jgi:hypothetical protein
MTDQPQDSPQYWYIPIPKNQFSKPKFHLGQQVGLPWENEFGTPYYDIGVIVGMQYMATRNQPAQWYYRIRFLKCDCEPWLVGSYDEIFEAESHFVADDTASAD